MRAIAHTLSFVVLAMIPLHAQSAPEKADPEQVVPMQKSAAPLKLPASKIPPRVPLSPRERAVQMLNRFTYGPRPGDVEKVLAMGPDKWFEQQLNPAAIPDGALEKRLNDYPTLNLPPEQTLTIFPDRGMIQQVADGRKPYPTDDPLLQSVYEVQVFKLLQEQDQTKNGGRTQPPDDEIAAQKKLDQAIAARIVGELLPCRRRTTWRR